MTRIYLDHNATSPPLEAARRAMERVCRQAWGNPASPHTEGRQAREIMERARREVARLARVDPGWVIFTSGGTEAAHLVLRGAAQGGPERGQKVVLSGLEHACMRGAAHSLTRQGFQLATVPPDEDGVIDAERFVAACGPGTAVAALLVAHNEIGTLQPVETVARELSLRGIPLVADGVQAAGRLPFTQPAGELVLGILSGHKFGGIAGAGAAIVDPHLHLRPVLRGGSQEHGRRGGTPGVGVLAAMGAAATGVTGNRGDALQILRDRFESLLLAGTPGIKILGRQRARLPNTSAFLAEKIKGEDLVAAMDLEGIAISTGAACSTGAATPSDSLLAMGLETESARGLVRLSLGIENTMGEMETAAEAVIEIVRRLRGHVGRLRAAL